MAQISNRILLFSTAYKPLIGGSEIAVEQINRRLPNIFFDIITPRYSRMVKKKENVGNTQIYRVGFGFKKDKFLFPILGLFKALSLRRKHGYKIIHSYQASHAGGAAWLMKIFFPGLKFILTMQEGKRLDRQNFAVKFARNLIIRKADIITAISEYLVNFSKKLNKKAEILLIPNGVDMEKFKIQNSKFKISEDLRKKLGIKMDERIIISTSRLVSKNGISDLIDAIAITKCQTPNVKCLIIGDGPLKQNLKFKIKNLKLESDIFMIGEISYEEVPYFLSIADIFARPSLSEGLGTAFLEAMACGIPVIGTSVGGITDFLKDPSVYPRQATGLFCKVNDPKDLAEKIVHILTDKELKDKIVANARTVVSEKYDWNIIAEQFKALY